VTTKHADIGDPKQDKPRHLPPLDPILPLVPLLPLNSTEKEKEKHEEAKAKIKEKYEKEKEKYEKEKEKLKVYPAQLAQDLPDNKSFIRWLNKLLQDSKQQQVDPTILKAKAPKPPVSSAQLHAIIKKKLTECLKSLQENGFVGSPPAQLLLEWTPPKDESTS